MQRVIENARLIEKRTPDGAQLYRWNDNPHDCIWLTGWERPSSVKVGDCGRLVYRVGPTYGLYFFEPYAKTESK